MIDMNATSNRQYSFRKQVLWLASALLIALSLLIAVATTLVSREQIRSLLFTQGMEWSQSLARNSVVAFLYKDAEIVRESVRTIMDSGKIDHLELITANGDSIIKQGMQHDDSDQYPKKHNSSHEVNETQDAWYYSVAVTTNLKLLEAPSIEESGFIDQALHSEQQDELLGYVHIKLSKQSLDQAGRQIFFNNLAIAILISSVLIIILLFLTRKLFAPLENLADLMSKASHGSWQTTNKLSGPTEIKRISQTYNNMIDTLKQRDDELVRTNQNLEATVVQRTQELEESNEQLKAFNYSVSHDLRAPLRGIDGFSHILEEDYRDQLDESGRDYLKRIRLASQRMGNLIDDLLKLSRLNQAEMKRKPVLLDQISHEVIDPLLETEPERDTEIIIHSELKTNGDPGLVRILLENLIGNAWKYSGKSEMTYIEIGRYQEKDNTFFIRDKGAGFSMQYADKLFAPFQRLHKPDAFEGTGIGLATVKRIVDRHGGRVWVESAVDEGTTFYFSLGYPDDNALPSVKT